MKKCLSILLLGVLMASCLVLAGCGQQKAKETSSTPAAQQKEKGGGNELDDVMNSAVKVTDLSFEMVSTSTSAGQTVAVQGKYWVSGKKVRIEAEAEAMKSVTLVNAKGETWMYNPADKTAMKLPTPKEENKMPNEWSKEDPKEAYKIVGHEKKDGYDCIVVTVTEDNDTSKMWLRKDIGMPVRMESKSGTDSMVVEYKNYKVGKQAADLFEVPADAQVISMPDMSNIPKMPTNP